MMPYNIIALMTRLKKLQDRMDIPTREFRTVVQMRKLAESYSSYTVSVNDMM
jgi:hypothetical protein